MQADTVSFKITYLGGKKALVMTIKSFFVIKKETTLELLQSQL